MLPRPSVHWLLALVPVAAGLDRAGAAAPLVFLVAALAIVPLAALIVAGTEQVAERTGPAVGGLLNATFGNLPELIIAVVALRAGLVEMVRASLIGAVLANVLLALGVAFLLGGRRQHVMEYNPGAARTYASMLMLAVITLALPAAFHRFLGASAPASSRTFDIATSLVLLATYVCYLVYMVKTHPDFFSAREAGAPEEGHGPRWSAPRAVGTLVAASLGAAWMSEVLVGAAEATGHALGMSPIFLGLVLLAVIGGAAESGSAITMGRRNKPDLAVGIAMGSSIQIALFVAPVLVLLSGMIGAAPLGLAFTRLEIGALLLGTLIVVTTSGDGQATWFKGIQLLAVYLIIAGSVFWMPVVAP
ncbi:MAG TPA: calcium/proton exchanger [Methylomirabilota bacterium]|nr:calcium/proton exchanger [Methylomirabilota bacterium]